MAWIESHTVLSRHRKVSDLANLLGIPKPYASGLLHTLWHSALEQQEDGDLSKWSDAFISESAGWPGEASKLISAMSESGFIDGRLLHDWVDYAGKYLIGKYHTSNKKRLCEIWRKHGRIYGSVNRKHIGSKKEVKSHSTLPDLTLPNPTKPTEPKKTSADKPAGPQFWKEMIEHLDKSWSHKKRGARYPWSGKDFAHLKRILRIYQPFDVMALWDLYINSYDEFASKQGYNIPEFVRQIPRLIDGSWKTASQHYMDVLMPKNDESMAKVNGLISQAMAGKEIKK